MKSGQWAELGGWHSRTTFVLALSAAVVGLGNLWRFSSLVGEHGGAPFVIAYVACLLLVAVPVLVAEVAIGSYGRASPRLAWRHAADRSFCSRQWAWVGSIGALTGLLILSYHSVVAGWILAYLGYMRQEVFSAASPVLVVEQFQALLDNPRELIYWHTVFLLLTLGVLALGVRRGLGVLAWLVVPAMIVLLGMLVQFALDSGNLEAARGYLFSVRWADYSARTWLAALGHAFYTLGAGVGIGIVYGAYSPKRLPVGRAVLAVAVFDSVLALFAGLAIFPVVLANNVAPATGPGLMFVSLPYAYGNLFQGEMFGSLFFALSAAVALGTAVALLEPAVTLVMQRYKQPRLVVVLLLGWLVWLLGFWVALSFGAESLGGWLGYGNGLLLLDALTARLLPLVGLLTAVFVGWRVRPELLRTTMERESGGLFQAWLLLLRWVAVPAMAVILVAGFWRA